MSKKTPGRWTVTTELGLGLLGGNNEVADGEWMRDYLHALSYPPGLSEVGKSRYQTEKALQFILDNPQTFAHLMAKKFGLFWGIKMDGGYKHQDKLPQRLSLIISTAGQAAVVGLFVLGLIAAFPFPREVMIALLPTISLLLITVVFYFLTRYRLVLYPLWAPVCVYGLLSVDRIVARKRFAIVAMAVLMADWAWIVWRNLEKIQGYAG